MFKPNKVQKVVSRSTFKLPTTELSGLDAHCKSDISSTMFQNDYVLFTVVTDTGFHPEFQEQWITTREQEGSLAVPNKLWFYHSDPSGK